MADATLFAHDGIRAQSGERERKWGVEPTLPLAAVAAGKHGSSPVDRVVTDISYAGTYASPVPAPHHPFYSYSEGSSGSATTSAYPGMHRSQAASHSVFPHSYSPSATTGTAGTYAGPDSVPSNSYSAHFALEGSPTTGTYPGYTSRPTSDSAFSHTYAGLGNRDDEEQSQYLPQPSASTISYSTQQSPQDDDMIRVSGPKGYVVASHLRGVGPSRGPSRDRLHVLGNAPYNVPSRHVPPLASSSSSLSRTSSIWSSVDEGIGPKRRAPRGTYKNTVDATSLRWYPPNIQKVLTFARHSIVNDMINGLGWPYGVIARTAYEAAMIEGISQANDAFKEKVELTYNMQTLLLKEPTYVRSKAVEYAEEYAEKFFVTRDADLLADPQRYQDWKIAHLAVMSDHGKPSFFFHEHDSAGGVERWFGNTTLENFHCDFWYTTNFLPVKYFLHTYSTTPTRMYALSATALLCACRRVATGRKHNSKNVLPFSSENYGPVFDVYHTAVVEYLNHADIGPIIGARLDCLNAEGLTPNRKKIELANCVPAAPKKIDPVYVPPPQQAESRTNLDSDTFLPQPESYPQYSSGEMSGSGNHTEPGLDF
ncbi:hypothetical protein HD554DRAFT_2176026 [Boletus coccyginus]|nr:hypothetical protein HD554DRAFT_2176026 [Boletus coccyginus]